MGCGVLFAIFLIFIGAWIWASNYGITIFSFYRDWPFIVVLVGLYLFIKLKRRKYRHNWKRKE